MRQMTLVRPGALGDTLLALPSLALLRAREPSVRLTFIARADVLPIALASGLADEAWPWDLPDWAALFDPAITAASLTERARAALAGADAVIAWTPDPDGAFAAALHRLGVSHVSVAPGQPPEDRPGEHMSVSLARALAPLGITPPDTRDALWRALPTLRWPEASAREAERAWRGLGLPEDGVIALHPGSGGVAKRWPPERFATLAIQARDSGYTPLLLAGEADAEVVAAVLERAAQPLPVARGLDVAALAALLTRCAGYIGNDSGVSHLAGMIGVPTLAIFGPTDSARWAPLGPRVIVARALDGGLARWPSVTVWSALHDLITGEE